VQKNIYLVFTIKLDKYYMSRLDDFEKLGGRSILVKMSKIFYDDVYKHEWIGKFFQGIDQDIIEAQQVDFLQGALGGEKVYCGKLPIPAHKHMFISDELYNLRTDLMVSALKEVNASQELIDKILKIDASFKGGLVKKSITDCEKRYNTDEILIVPNPDIKKSA
jgi:hemoglobin